MGKQKSVPEPEGSRQPNDEIPETEPGTGTDIEDPVGEEDSAARAIEEEIEGEARATDQLLEELEELRERHLRLAAEFDNYRKRTRQELLKTRELAQADLAARLLDAIDDLRRIAEMPADATTIEALHDGIVLVERKLLKELREAGLEPLEAEGSRFDPNLHEALTTVPTEKPEEDEQVAQVLVRGYRFGDRLLRPARVQVKKHQPRSAGEEDPGG